MVWWPGLEKTTQSLCPVDLPHAGTGNVDEFDSRSRSKTQVWQPFDEAMKKLFNQYLLNSNESNTWFC